MGGTMKKNRYIIIFFTLTAIISIIFFCLKTFQSNTESNKPILASHEYISLLSKFPKEKQGNSLEPVLKPEGPSEQPMTYGLVLSSESLHYRAIPNEESYERIKNAVRWIIDNSDLNKDGNPGWGLPQTFDAFADGSINAENHPYTITTAIVLEGLLDALLIESFWSEVEEKEIKDLISDVILYWLNNVYIGDENIGYFGYSEEPTDMVYTPNVSGMFLSSMVRALKEHEDIFEDSEKIFVTKRTHAIANQLVNTVILENDLPYWIYAIYPDRYEQPVLNDLVHHVYIIWGLEEYRKHFDEVKIPFDLEASLESLDSFWRDGKIYSYPQNRTYTGKQSHFNDRPSNLWGVGMMVAFYAKYGQSEMANKVIEIINQEYGPIPDLRMWPKNFSSDEKFYARYAAHVLLGLSYRDFYKN